MTSFSATLADFRKGTCTLAHLTSLVERDIALGVSAASDLLDTLHTHHEANPFEEATLTGIVTVIRSAETLRMTQIGATSAATGTVVNEMPTTQSSKSSAPQDRLPEIGDTLNNRFVLEELIGSGGMSLVFKATDKRKLEARSRQPWVAVKIMRVEGLDAGEAFIAMQREVQKSQALNHQHIMRVNDFDRDGNTVFTTMELLEGQSLSEVIAQAGPGGLPKARAMSIIKDMCSAMAYAHNNNIVHADFKPNNVFITNAQEVKVIDFGIARAIQTPDLPDDQRTVFDPAALGALTPAYASPEMFENQPTDPRDDIYAIGCVAYELFAGRHPYSKLRATDARDNEHDLKRPKGLVNHEWEAIVHALEFERDDRVIDVETFMAEIESGTSASGVRTPVLAALLGAVCLAAGAFWFLQPSVSKAPTVLKDCSYCSPLTVVASGSAVIGADRTQKAGMFEFPRRDVQLQQSFALGSREVTVAEFRRYAVATGVDLAGCRTHKSEWQIDAAASWEQPGFRQTDSHPVTCISWNDAKGYIQWLSATTGEYYRLPSEVEWEYAATTESGFSSEFDGVACGHANVADQTLASVIDGSKVADCRDGYAYTAPTDRESAAEFGLADMRGNLFEWTQDCWNPSYIGAPTTGDAWQDGDCSSRVLRGGSWFTAPDEQRLTYRNRFPTNYRSNTFGFRIARDHEK